MRVPSAVVAAAILGLALSGSAPLLADSAATKNNEGNRLYGQEKYDEAMKMYTDAQASRPQAPELHYNIGNVLFRKGEFDKAVEEYRRAQAAKETGLSEAATYNRGNALLAQGKFQDAVRAYIEALRADPADHDAKRNLELALRKMEEQKKKQEQQQKQPSGEKKDDKQGSPKEPQPGEQEPGEKKPPQPKPGEMTEEEARRILEALRQEEKEGIKKHARAAVPEARPPERDW